MNTHGNRKGIKEEEWREVSKKFCRACRLPLDVEFRLWDKKEKKYRRNDMLVKYKPKRLSKLKEVTRKNDLTVYDLIDSYLNFCLSLDLLKKNWQIVLFDVRTNSKKQGNTRISTIQMPPRSTIKANKPDETEVFEIGEIQNVASGQIREAEHLSWNPEITVCQGYIQALITQYGYESVVSAAKSAKAGLA